MGSYIYTVLVSMRSVEHDGINMQDDQQYNWRGDIQWECSPLVCVFYNLKIFTKEREKMKMNTA